MDSSLTTQDFWKSYWDSKRDDTIIGENYLFSDLFKKTLSLKSGNSMIEVGGFPGNYAIFFKKYWHTKSSIVDYVINKKTISNILRANGLNDGVIDIYKKDFFNWKTKKRFDLVLSLGFLEHFNNVEQVIEKHWQLVNPGGEMLITIPNFLGINGLLQFIFDPNNLNIHNLASMNISRLSSAVKFEDVASSDIFYWGGFSVWLEKLQQKNIIIKLLVYALSGLGIIIRLLGINNKLLSPYIVLYAKKKK